MITEYITVFKQLNNQKLQWCLIKDHKIILQNKYTNEIDITLLNKDRNKFLKIGKSLGWYLSSISRANTHAVLFKFKDGKALRIDAHIGRALATTAPWIKTEKLLSNRIKTKEVWHLIPKWELIIIIMASIRGKKINLTRVHRAKELNEQLQVSKLSCPKLSSEEFEKYYDLFVARKQVKLNKFKRLGLKGIITHQFTKLKILISRLFNPGKTLILAGNNNKITNALHKFLKESKISTKTTKSLFLSLILRILADTVIVTKNIRKPKYIFKNAIYFYLDEHNNTANTIHHIINTIWPEKNENS